MPFAECIALTDNPETIIDGIRYPIPNVVGGDYAFDITTFNERLEDNDFTDVKIYLGKLWAAPAATVRHRCGLVRGTRVRIPKDLHDRVTKTVIPLGYHSINVER